MAHSPPLLGRLLRGSNWSAELGRYAAAPWSQITPRSRNSHWKTTQTAVMQRYSWLHHTLNSPTPNRVCKTVCSSALDLITGAKSMVGVAAVCLFPDPGAVLIFNLFCVFFTSFFWMPKLISSMTKHCNTFPKLSGSSLCFSNPVFLRLHCTWEL